MQKRTKHYLAYGAAIVVLCMLFAANSARHAMEAEAQSKSKNQAATGGVGVDGDASTPSKSAKSAERPTAPKPASEKEAEKFRRFFLPPLKLENATIEEAVAAIVAAYRETASATGETALDLRVDLASARTRKPLTCTTPRAPAGTMLRYVAALAGNSTKGSLPNFRLEALSDVADRKGKIEISPGWKTELADFLASANKVPEAKLPEDPFAKPAKDAAGQDDPFSDNPPPKVNLKELLLTAGFNPDLDCKQTGNSLSYENMSEAELELLAALVETTGNGGIGPVQLKSSAKLLEVPESMAAQLSAVSALTDAEVQISMRQFAQTKGVDLLTTPSITARVGENALVEIVNTTPTQDGGETWNGVKLATAAVPYGLGSQVEFAIKTRDLDGKETTAREQVTLPENASGVATSASKDGKTLVVVQGNQLIDATGQPIAPPP